ncbi:MAG TPA: hypothetical protein V6D30_16890 [Leptolyngbyaceae cyanobacterium]
MSKSLTWLWMARPLLRTGVHGSVVVIDAGYGNNIPFVAQLEVKKFRGWRS